MSDSPGVEPVDVVDEHDRVVGTVTRAEMRARRLRHRTVFVLVVSSGGRLLAHRRSGDKDLWPGRWDLGCGGVLTSGEDYEPAARREVAEELGIEVGELRLLVAGAYRDDDVDEIGRIYVTVHDGPFRFADGEIVEARFVDRTELDELLGAAPFVPDSLAMVPLDEVLPPARPRTEP